MNPKGGTEILIGNLVKYVGVEWEKYINMIISVCDPTRISSENINVLWQHLMTDQPNVQLMNDSNFVNSIQHYVYVSEWQREQFEKTFPCNFSNNHVIRNAIEPIKYLDKPTDGKLKLIYASMPNRGLEVLLDAFDIINNDDIELHVYSSNIIYGKGYNSAVNSEKLFHRCKNTKNVIYKGYAMNAAIRKAMQSSHILAYPSIFPETSCMVAIEAGSAGCKIVTTNYGALPETCSDWATFVDHTFDHSELVHRYAEVLNKEIANYSTSSYNAKGQSEWFNNRYSWENRKHEWLNFFNIITQK